MAFDYQKLRGRIVGECGRLSDFAEKLGVSEQTVSAKLNNKSRFTQEDVLKWSEILHIESADVGEYFFVQKV